MSSDRYLASYLLKRLRRKVIPQEIDIENKKIIEETNEIHIYVKNS